MASNGQNLLVLCSVHVFPRLPEMAHSQNKVELSETLVLLLG